MAIKGLIDCTAIDKEAGDIKTLRWASARAFATGKLTDVPVQSRRQLTQEERETIQKLSWKLHCRQGKAEIALCYQALDGSGLMSQRNIEQARIHRAKAIECE